MCCKHETATNRATHPLVFRKVARAEKRPPLQAAPPRWRRAASASYQRLPGGRWNVHTTNAWRQVIGMAGRIPTSESRRGSRRWAKCLCCVAGAAPPGEPRSLTVLQASCTMAQRSSANQPAACRSNASAVHRPKRTPKSGSCNIQQLLLRLLCAGRWRWGALIIVRP